MFASDSAVVSTSCATWPQAGLRATHARPRTKRPLQLTRGPPPASVGVGAPLRLPRATPVRTWSPCVAELCRARHARSQNPGTKGRTSDNGRRRSRPATLTPSRLAHCHATPADGPSLTVIFDAYDLDAHCSVELPHAFVAGPDELKKLATLLNDRIGSVDIRVDCADDVSRDFTSVRELIAYENPKAKEIRRIHLTARSDDYSKRATIDLSASRWRGISLDYTARDDVVSRLRTESINIIAGMRPWYSIMHQVDFVSTSLFAYMFLWFGLVAVVAFKLVPVSDPNESNPNSSAFAQLVVFGGIAALFGIGIILNRFRDSIFPRAVFTIGQGESRFNQLERFQWGVIIAFLASFAAGLVIAVWQTIAA